MKYKIGDKVKLRKGKYNSVVQAAIDEQIPDMIGVIEDILSDRFDVGNNKKTFYHIEGFEFSVMEKEIEYLIIDEPITSRFEILDL